MADNELHISMLGSFTLEYNGKRIDDSDNRSRKSWLLLAYLIYYRNRKIPQDELIKLLWEDDDNGNPQNAIKTLLHRVRAMLNGLGSEAGHNIIVRREGAYAINPNLSIICDIDNFSSLCVDGHNAQTEISKLEYFLQALDIYKGEFLPRLSMEHWTIPIEAYYHSLYIETALETVSMLDAAGRTTEAVSVCRKALEIEPYNEQLYIYLMKELTSIGDKDAVVKAYDRLSSQLFSNFGILPSDEASSYYRDAVNTINEKAVLSGTLREQLREASPVDGAFICNYDIFKVLYQAEARLVERSGDVYHIAMVTMSGKPGQDVARRSIEHAMVNLRDVLKDNLRTGDIISQCSVSQYILMLPQANYEQSRMVCQRVVKAFYRQYPHTPVNLDFCVQPLEPNLTKK